MGIDGATDSKGKFDDSFIIKLPMQALRLMGSADQDSVKVAAIGRYSDIIRLEIELRQSLGKLRALKKNVTFCSTLAPQTQRGLCVLCYPRVRCQEGALKGCVLAT